jgi:ATP/maltotriose-dependent transcriptional regulator MalT
MARHKTLGDVAGEALCLTNLSLLHEERGEHASAIASLKAALAISDRHGFLNTRAIILANLTGLAVTTGDFASAEDFAGRGLEIAQATSNRYLVAFLKLQLVRLAARRDNLGLARAELAAAVDIAIAIGRPALLLGAVSCLAEVLEAQGDADCAYRVLSFSAGHPATNAPEREDLQKRMARLPSPTSAASPKIGLDDLVHRMVVERDLAYAPLIAFLRGTR